MIYLPLKHIATPKNRAQVRTLEKALEDGFDVDRRLHGWAREGMEMEREEFIDLAFVSRQVPGKSPAQVRLHSSHHGCNTWFIPTILWREISASDLL